MSLKLKYIIYIFIIHAILTALVFYLLREQKLYFFLAEIAIIGSLIVAYVLFQNFIRPIEFIKDGRNAIIDKDFNVKYISTNSSEMNALILVYNDMIDNIRAERIQVQEQHYFLQKLINASPNGIVILDFEDKITDLNPRAIKVLEIKGNWENQSISNFENPILKAIQNIEVNTSEVISVRGVESYKCEVSSFIHRGFKRKFILIQELSKEILAAEKRAYGKVIRMMAHEVNNSIGAINSILHSVVEIESENKSENDSEMVIEALTVAINRNDNLNQFMRNFADVIRIPKPNLEQIDLNILIQNVSKLMQNQAEKKAINYHFDLNPNPVFVHADLRLMEQALVNMIKNSMEAIEEKEVESPNIIRFQTFPNGFSISDNGSGISAAISNKIFTPFFSTKITGQGVGLTLIREILLNHKTTFSLKTNDDDWTAFEVRFLRE